jgi:hypothetical protein
VVSASTSALLGRAHYKSVTARASTMWRWPEGVV